MPVSNIIAPHTSNVSSFHNLALFICHLFIDGHFRVSHIIHNPNIFENQIINEIESYCPTLIPTLITDVTQSLLLPSHKDEHEQSDHILQLIFFDPHNFEDKIEYYDLFIAFYRLLVISTTDGNCTNNQTIEILKTSAFSNGNLLIVCYDPWNGTIWILEDSKVIVSNRTSITQRHWNMKGENLFHQIFGDFGRNWLIMISYTVAYPCSKQAYDSNTCKLLEIWNGSFFLAYFYETSLNASYVNQTSYYADKSNTFTEHHLHRQRNRGIYDEIRASPISL